ncbi:MAG: hypothetical protein JST17_01290 [Bacteroidetes bacterium]|nr:hypothetical protein [Bacteroidota bacterium]MBS1931918.1 hypothetical protein [Bacteroidota bacterium]
MNAKIDQLVQSVLKKNTLAECSVAELQTLAEQFPYSSALQLLYTVKLKTADQAGFKQQLQKTSLFFSDPLWLNYLVNETGNLSEDPEKKNEDQIIKEQEPIKTEVPSLEKIPLLKKEKSGIQKQDLLFEPYHTIDYFASQGIKFKSEDKPQDKFGQQLKSFTEWLKILKQSPLAEISKPVETNQEQKVEQLAAHSIEDRDVVTEAMAEVWEKQGNTVKAIEIYNKLGLLDPSKIAYFAGKIEHLKNLI